jgi:hypothetical protein
MSSFRRATRCGEIDVLVVSDGVDRCQPRFWPPTRAGRPGGLAGRHVPAAEWPLNVVVVRSGGRTVLIDAGLGVEYPDFPRAGRLAQ